MSNNIEMRLFDIQWLNIVNAHDCWDGHTKEEAVLAAIKMTEQAMVENINDNLWPKNTVRK